MLWSDPGKRVPRFLRDAAERPPPGQGLRFLVHRGAGGRYVLARTAEEAVAHYIARLDGLTPAQREQVRAMPLTD